MESRARAVEGRDRSAGSCGTSMALGDALGRAVVSLAGMSCFIGRALATPSPWILTPGTHCLLTPSPKAVSCSCLGSQC